MSSSPGNPNSASSKNDLAAEHKSIVEVTAGHGMQIGHGNFQVNLHGSPPRDKLRAFLRALAKWRTGAPLDDAIRDARSGDINLSQPHQLPPDVAKFVGRSEELGRLTTAATLRADGKSRCSCVVVYGGGGMGKTGMVVHAAHNVQDKFKDGVVFIDAAHADSTAMPPAYILRQLLRYVGMAAPAIPEELVEMGAALRTTLATKTILVIIDNIIDASQVAHCLPGVGRSLLIVTSRPPVPQIESAEHIRLSPLSTDESVTLLSLSAGIRVSPSNTESLLRLVAALEGLPLALRVAGAQIANRPSGALDELSVRVATSAGRFNTLSTGEVGLRASIRFSHRLLEAPEQRVLSILVHLETLYHTRVSVSCAAGISQEHAQAVLDRLVDVQLLEVRDGANNRSLRYSVHDLIREFVKELGAPLDMGECVKALGDFYLSAVATLGRRLEAENPHLELARVPNPHELPAPLEPFSIEDRPLDWFEAELQNLLAVLKQLASNRLDSECIGLLVAMICFFEARVFWREWKDANGIVSPSVDRASDRSWRAAHLWSVGRVEHYLGDWSRANEALMEARDLFAFDGHAKLVAMVSCNIARIHMLGRFGQAEAFFQSAATTFAHLNHRHNEAYALVHLADVIRLGGNAAGSVDLFRRGISILDSYADLYWVNNARLWLAEAYRELGQIETAEQTIRQAIDGFSRMGEARRLAVALVRLGRCQTASAQPLEALRTLLPALSYLRYIHDSWWTAMAYEALAYAYAGKGATELALQQADLCLAPFDSIGNMRSTEPLRKLKEDLQTGRYRSIGTARLWWLTTIQLRRSKWNRVLLPHATRGVSADDG